MDIFSFIVPSEYYRDRKIPRFPGITEHLMYVEAKDLPENIPSGCNPRAQDPDKTVYKKVLASFEDVEDNSFCLKNKGITILATSVKATCLGKTTRLDVNIPSILGNVDGNHSYLIALKGRDKNPSQYVGLRVLEGVPVERIPPVAEGLNTGLQVTARSMANLQHLLDPIHRELREEPYYQNIKFRDNEANKSVDVKDIVALMWTMCPSLYEGRTSKHPSWIYQKSSAVFDQAFFNLREDEKENSTRSEMLKTAPVLRQIVAIYLHVAAKSVTFMKKAKVKKGRGEEKPQEEVEEKKKEEVTINSLFEVVQKVPFRDPNVQAKIWRLREPYLRMLVAGTRCLLQYNIKTGAYEFKVDQETILALLDSKMKKILGQFVDTLKRDSHGKTMRNSALWDNALVEIENAYLKSLQQIVAAE